MSLAFAETSRRPSTACLFCCLSSSAFRLDELLFLPLPSVLPRLQSALLFLPLSLSFFASPLLGACLSLNASFFLLAAGAGFPSSPPLFGEPPLHGSLFPLGAAFPLPPPAFAEALLAKLRYPVLNYHASAPSVQADFREASKSFFRICFR